MGYGPPRKTTRRESADADRDETLEKMIPDFRTRHNPGPAVPALMQIFGPLPAPFRVELANRWKSTPTGNDIVIGALVRLALFDPEASVRQAAVRSLEQQPVEQYGPKLVDGFRHPSPYVAEHAADALVALKRVAPLPMVVDLLDEPDLPAQFERNVAGTKTLAIREVVKVNHLRNCILCHAPVSLAEAGRGGGRGVPGGSRGLIAPGSAAGRVVARDEPRLLPELPLDRHARPRQRGLSAARLLADGDGRQAEPMAERSSASTTSSGRGICPPRSRRRRERVRPTRRRRRIAGRRCRR